MKSLTKSDSSLRTVFRINAAFSGLNGVIMAIAPNQIASLLGISGSQSVFIVGLNLIAFAAFLVWVTQRPSIPRSVSWGIVSADIAWVVFTAIGLTLVPHSLTRMGTFLILDVAIIVSAFAVAQVVFLRKPLTVVRQ